jgi:hypothetical protein
MRVDLRSWAVSAPVRAAACGLAEEGFAPFVSSATRPDARAENSTKGKNQLVPHAPCPAAAVPRTDPEEPRREGPPWAAARAAQ